MAERRTLVMVIQKHKQHHQIPTTLVEPILARCNVRNRAGDRKRKRQRQCGTYNCPWPTSFKRAIGIQNSCSCLNCKTPKNARSRSILSKMPLQSLSSASKLLSPAGCCLRMLKPGSANAREFERGRVADRHQ